MRLSRRGFFKTAGMAVATVAIGMRLSHGFPVIDRWVSERYGGFTYAVNLNNPWQVRVWIAPFGAMNEAAEIPVGFVNHAARVEHRQINDGKEVFDRAQHLELAAVIAMSQVHAFENIGHPMTSEYRYSVKSEDVTIPLAQVFSEAP